MCLLVENKTNRHMSNFFYSFDILIRPVNICLNEWSRKYTIFSSEVL